MDWDNLYVIIIIGLAFALAMGLIYLVPKLLPLRKESTSPDSMAVYSCSTVLMPLILQHHSKKELKQVEGNWKMDVWQKKYPPNTQDYTFPTGGTWKFETTHQQHSNVIVHNGTLLIFPDDALACSLMSNLELPRTKPFVYFEATMLELTHIVALGLSTKPYPSWRLPGWHHHSVAYHSSNGCVYTSNPKHPSTYGPGFEKDDVIGVGYLSHSNTVFFTKNGRNLGKAITGFKFPIYPSIGAIGKTKIMVNFGQQAFRYDSANVWQAGLLNNDDLPLPPPTYGTHLRDTLLFDPSSSPDVLLSVASPAEENDHPTSFTTPLAAPATAACTGPFHLPPPPPNYPL